MQKRDMSNWQRVSIKIMLNVIGSWESPKVFNTQKI